MGLIASAFGVEDETTPLTLELLKKCDSVTSTVLIDKLKQSERFLALSKKEGDDILQRDTEDGEKLAKGIQLARDKGVLDDKPPAPYTQVDVLGKTADEVAAEIIGHLGEGFKGGVLVLVGLSGTGKGTTVSKLKEKLPNAITWSNGNVFRSLTLLAATFSQQQYGEFNKAVLTPENIAAFMKMLTFGKFDGKHDIHIEGLGHDLYVSQVANTVLKGPMVGSNIPTVAEVTQGEVVKFASAACAQMGADGITVLLEGREQTVNYIETPHRFELVMSDARLIGMRRAAQRINAKALELVGDATDDQAALAAVALALSQLASEMEKK